MSYQHDLGEIGRVIDDDPRSREQAVEVLQEIVQHLREESDILDQIRHLCSRGKMVLDPITMGTTDAVPTQET